MSIDVTAIMDRVTSRAYAWSTPTGAPAPVREAAAAYQRSVTALDDSLVEYQIEVSERRALLRQHNEAVAAALREGKLPPKAKVPSLEEIEVRHGAIIAAREGFVQEAALTAERVALEHYPQWRAEVVQQLQGAAAAVLQSAIAAAEAADDWGNTAQLLARLDRSWAPRTAQLDDTSFQRLLDTWAQHSSVEATQLRQNMAQHTDRLRQLAEDPVVSEYDPSRGGHQYTTGFLAQQSPGVREEMLRQAVESIPTSG
ncbi:MAG: hypothetical protein Q8R60_08805 [Mycobacteriales bacterium]|nr:hypothetical protein [Mycobacteriales bacterium]